MHMLCYAPHRRRRRRQRRAVADAVQINANLPVREIGRPRHRRSHHRRRVRSGSG